MGKSAGRLRGPISSRILLYGLPGLGSALAAVVALLSVGRITPLLLGLTAAVVVLGFGAPPAVEWLSGRHSAREAKGQEAARREQIIAGKSAAALREHFGPRGRGILPSSVRSGQYFTGRSRVLAELTAWLVDAADTRARIVTGAPGSGKSAVLGRLVTLEAGAAISAAVLARGSTVDEVAAAVAQSLDIDESSPGGLLSALRESRGPGPTTIVVDAIDEAADPLRLIIELLEPLAAAAARTQVRLLAGTRRGAGDNLLRLFGATAAVIDLDSPAYFDQHDVADYVSRTLTAAADPQVATPYRDHPGLATTVAGAVAAHAGGSFLIAQLTALALAAAPQPLDVTAAGWTEDLPSTVEAAMERYLREVKPSGRWLRDLLMALAWSEGDGLEDIATWAAFATAIGTGQYTGHDVTRLLLSTSAVDLLHPTKRDGRTAFRLFHESLAEYLRRESCQFLSPAEIQHRFTGVIVAGVPVHASGDRDWSRADRYTRTFLPAHAAAGEAIDALLSDGGFLVTAEPGRLLAALPAARNARGRQLAQVIQRVGQQLLVAPPGEQACYLEMAAQMAGDTRLAAAVAQAAPDRPWSVPWARWQPLAESLLLGHHDDYVISVSAVETPGRTVVVAASQWTLRAWALPAGTPVSVGLGEAGAPTSAMVAFAEAGRVVVLLLLDNGDVLRSVIDSVARTEVITRQRAARELWLVEHAGQPAIVTLTPEGGVEVLSAADGHRCELPAVNVEGCRILAAATIGERMLLAVTSDQEDDPAEVTVWDLAAGAVLGHPARMAALFPGAQPAPFWAAAFTERAGDPLLLCGGGSRVPVFSWDPLRAEVVGDPVHEGPALSMLAAGGGGHRGDADEVHCWGSTRGDLYVRRGDHGTPRKIAAHDDGIDTLAATGQGDRLTIVTGSRDGAVRVWQAGALPPAQPEQPRVTAMRVLPGDGSSPHQIARLLGDGTASVLDAGSGREVERLRAASPDASLTDLKALPGQPATLLTIDSEGQVATWQAPDDRLTPVWQLSPDGDRWNTAITAGDPPVLLVARTDGHVALLDAWTGQAAAQPVDTGNRKEYWVQSGTPGSGSGPIRFFALGDGPAVREWAITEDGLVTGRELALPAHSERTLHPPSQLAFARRGGELVIVGVGGYARISAWDAGDGSLLDSVRLEQAHSMALNAVDVTDFRGQPVVFCGGFTCTLAIWPLGSREERHLRVGSVIYGIRSLPADRVVVAAARGTMLIQLGQELPGLPTRIERQADGCLCTPGHRL